MPILAGSVAARGFNDHDRLVAGELVYMGLTRTPVAAIADRVPFRGRWSTMMNEYFATMADVWRVLDVLPPDLDQHATADNRPKDRVASMARLARMVGLDAGGGDEHDWLVLAAWLAEQQMRRIEDGMHLVQSALDLPPAAPVVAAGAGRFIVERIAARQNRRCIDFATLIGGTAGEQDHWASTCAPAVAVALLLAASRGERALRSARGLMGRDPRHQPFPGFAFLRAGGLVDGDLEIGDLALRSCRAAACRAGSPGSPPRPRPPWPG